MPVMTTTGWTKAGVLGVSLCVLFFYFLQNQHAFSMGSGDWSHSYFIPIISGYLLWQRRAELAAAKYEPFWPGILPLLVGIPAYALFQISGLSNHMAQGWALLLCIFGIVLLTCGPRVTKFAFLPIAFLIFGITISERVMIIITFQLQLIASKGAWALLNIIGVSTEVFGNALKVTDSQGGIHDLNVAEACSGMRMVIAFAALGTAVALAAAKLWWQRIALILLALPVAILMNVLRVGVLGVATLYDQNLVGGQAHMLIGTLLLLPAFGLYMGIVWCLNRAVSIEDDSPTAKATKATKAAGKSAAGRAVAAARAAGLSWAALRQPAFIAGVAIMLVSAATLNVAVAAMGVHLRKQRIDPPDNRRVSAIATETASYQRVGQDIVMSSEVVDELGTTNYLTRSYALKNAAKDQPNPRMELHLAYYTGMIDTVPHVPERCMTGAGWQVVGLSRRVPLKLDTSSWQVDQTVPEKLRGKVLTAPFDPAFSKDTKAERIRLPFEPDSIEMQSSEFTGPRGMRQVAGYFFIANGGHTALAEGVRAKAFNLTDDYAFYLKVQITSQQVASPEQLAEHASRLLGELLPEIMRCVPDWIEVQQGRYPPDNPRGAKSAK